jgi:hypothetical protein
MSSDERGAWRDIGPGAKITTLKIAQTVAANQRHRRCEGRGTAGVGGDVEAEGLSLNVMAARLNDQGVLTSRGKAGGWTATAVRRVLARLT